MRGRPVGPFDWTICPFYCRSLCETSAMTLEDPFIERSRAATALTLILALAAFAATLWYLWSGLPFTLINLSIAGVLLGGAVAGRWPITPRRAAISAGVWLLVGLPGSYVFGVFVFYAALLLGGALATAVLAAKVRRRLSAAPN